MRERGEFRLTSPVRRSANSVRGYSKAVPFTGTVQLPLRRGQKKTLTPTAGIMYNQTRLAILFGGLCMISTYTAKYTKIPSGYLGQLVEWPEVITEGRTLEECREMLQDALRQMIAAYRQQKKEIPPGRALLEQIPVEIRNVSKTR